MIIVSRLLRHSEANADGITYSKEALEYIASMQKGKMILGVLGDELPGYLDLTKVATKVVNMHVDDEGLVVEQEVLDTEYGNALANLLNDSAVVNLIKFTPLVVGTCDKDSTVRTPVEIRRITITSI